jgi:ABC-type uncharacterized transport system involved in gliding motility auxiliary subunit
MNFSGLRKGSRLLALAALFVAAIAIIELLLPRWRLDLTQDRLFTLSDGTRNILAQIEEPITLTYYFSEATATGAPQLTAHARRVSDLLAEYVAASGGKLRLKRVDPEPFSDTEDLAVAAGIAPVRLDDGRALYFGLTASGAGPHREVIAFFAPDREPQLEYDLTRLIYRLDTPVLPKVGLVSGLPMAFGAGGPLAMAQGRSAPYAVYEQLRQFFDLTLLDAQQLDIPDDIGVLILAHPPRLDVAARYAVDQFVMRGGRLILFIDPLNEVGLTDQSGPLGQPSASAPAVASDAAALIKPWGVTLQPGKVVVDLDYAQRVDMGDGAGADYPAWLALDRSALSSDDMITAPIARLNLAQAGALSLAPPAGVALAELILSSRQAQLIDVNTLLDNGDPASLLRLVKPDGVRHVLAARISGTLPSGFGETPPLRSEKPHLPQAQGMGTVIVVADADMLEDRFWVPPAQVHGGSYGDPVADNGAFVINTVDSLLGSTYLLSLRTRRPAQRPFTVIETMRQQAEIRLLKREASLQDSLAKTEARIQAMEAGGGNDKSFLTAEQKAEVERFRATVATTRLELRAVQRDLRRDVDRLTGWITAANILAAPLLLLACWIGWSWRRRQNAGR